MAHRQNSEQEAAIGDIGIGSDFVLQRSEFLIDFCCKRCISIVDAGATGLQFLQAGAPAQIALIGFDLLNQRIGAGESRCENNSGFVAQFIRQAPAIGELRAFCRRFVFHHQRNTGITQRIDTGGDGQRRDDIQSSPAIGREAKFFHEIETANSPGEFDYVSGIGDRFKMWATGF